MNVEQPQEIWQVDRGGEVYDATFDEMADWIDQGSLLKIDRVRRGNLRWIEAGKVPALLAVFNAKEYAEPAAPPVVTLTKLGPTVVQGSTFNNSPGCSVSPLNAPVNRAKAAQPVEKVCSIHPDISAVYVCETCANCFCKTCPNSYGGNVKICPFCGAICDELKRVVATDAAAAFHSFSRHEGFGIKDFGRALAYPFNFKTTFVLGALMYMFVSVGQGATAFGGIFMLAGSIACFMVANTLVFGILANTVENFSQGKIGLNFMPTFEEFSPWDDVVHPFFLSLGTYVVSFGPLLLLCIVGFFFVFKSTAGQMTPVESDAARAVTPELPYAANATQQSQRVRELLNKTAEDQKRRVAAMEKEEGTSESETQNFTPAADKTSTDQVEDIQKKIEESHKAQLESVVGKTPQTRAAENAAFIKQIFGYGLFFVVLAGLLFLWGILYFPAACAVAGYTRSFAATLNPTVGFDTIKHLGLDYVKILLMSLAIIIMSAVVSAVLGMIFSAFDLPSVGNLPAIALGSIFGFYLSIVFSCVLGFALYKAADRLQLCR